MRTIQLTKTDLEAIAYAIELFDPKDNEFVAFFKRLYNITSTTVLSWFGKETPIDIEEHQKLISRLSNITFNNFNGDSEYLLPHHFDKSDIEVTIGSETQILIDGAVSTKETAALNKSLFQLHAKAYMARVDDKTAFINKQKKEIELLEDLSSPLGVYLLQKANKELTFNLFPYTAERLVKEKLKTIDDVEKEQEKALENAFKSNLQLLASLENPLPLSLLVKQFKDAYAAIPSGNIMFNAERLKLAKLTSECHKILSSGEEPQKQSEQLLAMAKPLIKTNKDKLDTAKICEQLGTNNNNQILIYLAVLLCAAIPLVFVSAPIVAIVGITIMVTLAIIALSAKNNVYSSLLEKENALCQSVTEISSMLNAPTQSKQKENEPVHYPKLFAQPAAQKNLDTAANEADMSPREMEQVAP
jgi:hypothetical protein